MVLKELQAQSDTTHSAGQNGRWGGIGEFIHGFPENDSQTSVPLSMGQHGTGRCPELTLGQGDHTRNASRDARGDPPLCGPGQSPPGLQRERGKGRIKGLTHIPLPMQRVPCIDRSNPGYGGCRCLSSLLPFQALNAD